MNINTSIKLLAASWNWDEFFKKIIDWLQTSGLKLLIGVIALFLLFQVVNIIARSVRKSMRAHKKDEIVTNVVYNVISKTFKILLFLLFLGYVGIDTAGIGSIIASCAVAVGLALQGSLSNIAGWFIIIFMRPFKLGDYVECQSVSGTIEEIRLFYTHLVTPDNKVIMIPNGALANGNIINYSQKEIRRVENIFSIAYGDDVSKAIDVIDSVLNSQELILKEPKYFIAVSSCAASSIDITVRSWVKNADYWTVYFKLISEVKAKFDENNITIPFNQLDVHLDK